MNYHQLTNSVYVEVRSLSSCRIVEIAEDIALDVGSDGQPVGYDIWHASTKTEFIARLVPRQAPPTAAE